MDRYDSMASCRDEKRTINVSGVVLFVLCLGVYFIFCAVGALCVFS